MTPADIVFAEAERRLIPLCQTLGQRLDAGEDVGAEYVATLTALIGLVPPERRALQTTQEMAERLGVTSKTIRRWGKLGKLEHERHGKRGTGAIRWRA